MSLSPEQQLPSPTTPNRQRRLGLRVSGPGTLLASVALSTLATLSANAPGEPAFPRNPHIGMHKVIPGVEGIQYPGVGFQHTTTQEVENFYKCPDQIVYGQGTDHEVVVVTTEPMKFARGFDSDLAAGENLDNDAALTRVVDSIRAQLSLGHTIDGIEIHGFASGEDESGGFADGLGKPSLKNAALAEARAKAGADKLLPQLNREFGPAVANKIVVTGGTEIDDPLLNQAIFALAASKGMSPHMLMETGKFDSSKLTKSDLDVLQGLADDRYIAFTIRSSYPVLREEYVIEGGQCVTKTIEEKHTKLVIMLLPIPMIRRNTNDPVPQITTKPGPRKTNGPVVERRGSTGFIPKSQSHVVAAGYHQKQPGRLNDGGNHGSRGQRNPHPVRSRDFPKSSAGKRR